MSAPKTAPRDRAFCAASIILVSLAQICLKWSMLNLPHLPAFSFEALTALSAGGWAALAQANGWLPPTALLFGLGAYALSMLCWFLALRSLPLNLAYPMLSISYVIVYVLAAFLPGLAEGFGMLKSAGVLCILFGIRLISGSS